MSYTFDPEFDNTILAVREALARFSAVTLEEMDAVRLMNRVDRKFVFHIGRLPAILDALRPHYRTLQIGTERLSPYRTMYFDTDALAMYRDHHNGKPNRTKVRYRQYLQSGAVFFEVKRKLRGLRTDKVRIPIAAIPEKVNGAETDLLAGFNIGSSDLSPKLDIAYSRITLVRNDGGERVTLDVGLNFVFGKDHLGLENIVIAEVKTDSMNGRSPVIDLMRELVIRRMGMSKYALGIALMKEGAKTNAFKAKILKIKAINTSNETKTTA